ncbi:MAG TPA: radical SAM protein, partial [Candidatus Sulfotelmatobacter sp.]|nr:radical SAM protein [Candidatus Sulfotelmatobacter sp.]
MTVTRNGERAQNILLVSCYELGHQPLHVASAAAFLREAGHEVKAVDLAVESLDERAVMWADLVAIAVPMHTAMRLAAVVARRVRELRDRSVTVVTFGLYAPLCRSVIEGGLVDHAVGGEFEEELVRIAAGTPSSRTVVLDRLSFPVPARDLLPSLERYARLLVDGDQRLTGYVEATRGCVHKCRHCPVPAVYDGRIRVVQRQTMVEDVAQLHALGARHLTFGDPDFLNAVPHALAAARAVHERFPEMTFDVTTKIEHILEHRSVLAELRELGLIFVVTAAESTSARVLEILDKGHTRQQILEAVAVLRSHGIEPRPSWLPFTPWSGLEEYLDLLDLILDADLVDSTDPVQLTIRLLVPEGSLLLARPDMREHIVGHDPAT